MKKKDLEIHKLLKSADEEIVLEAIEEIRSSGNNKSFEKLLEVLITTESNVVYKSALNVLKNAKDKDAAETILKVLGSPKSKGHRHTLISLCWEADLKCDAHLDFLVDLAIKEDYLVCIEVVTVIENMAGSFSEEDAANSLNKLAKAISKKDERQDLFLDICDKIKSFKAALE